MLKVKFLVVSLVLLAFVYDTESTWWWRRNNKRSRPSRPSCSPRKCQVCPWSEWSACSHQCGTSGTQTRTRIKTVIEACGGYCPYHLKEIRSCNRDKCQNSGTPLSHGCSCPPGYSGKCCEIAKIVKGKFMEDGSLQVVVTELKQKLLHDHFSLNYGNISQFHSQRVFLLSFLRSLF